MNNEHWPVPYTLTPAAEALLEAGDRGMAAPWERQGRTTDTAEIHLTEERGRQADAEAWGGRGPSASYAEWLAEGQPEAGPCMPDPAAEAAAAADEFFGREPGTAARLLGEDLSPDPETAYEQAAEILDEWDSADSDAYQARAEAEGQPEAGS
jgi:hypothetical protein